MFMIWYAIAPDLVMLVAILWYVEDSHF